MTRYWRYSARTRSNRNALFRSNLTRFRQAWSGNSRSLRNTVIRYRGFKSHSPKRRNPGLIFKPSKLRGPERHNASNTNRPPLWNNSHARCRIVTKAGRRYSPSGTPAVRMPSIELAGLAPAAKATNRKMPGRREAGFRFGSRPLFERSGDRRARPGSAEAIRRHLPSYSNGWRRRDQSASSLFSARVVVAARAFAPRYDELFSSSRRSRMHDLFRNQLARHRLRRDPVDHPHGAGVAVRAFPNDHPVSASNTVAVVSGQIVPGSRR